MNYETLLIDQQNSVTTLSFNRPDKLNAFDKQMVIETQDVIKKISDDNTTKVLIITGIGKGFSAGADLSDPSGMDDHNNERIVYEGLVNGYMPSLKGIMYMPKPVIAAVNGPAAGIGSAFALACDLMVMSKGAYLKQAFVNIALIPDGGLNWFLTRAIGYKLAYEMAIEGDNISASRCLELGLTNKVVEADDLLNASASWAESLARKSTQSLRETKKSYESSYDCVL